VHALVLANRLTGFVLDCEQKNEMLNCNEYNYFYHINLGHIKLDYYGT